MAIPLKEMKATLGAALDRLSNETRDWGWAVTVEHSFDTMKTNIIKVEAFDPDVHWDREDIIHIPHGRDEMDAYLAAQKILEQEQWIS